MLYLSEFSTSLLWQSIVVFGTELHGTSPTVCQSPKFLVTNICDLPDVINCQFREFAAAPSGSVHFLSPDQQSGIHCLIICRIQLLTPNNLGGTWRRICSPDIRSVSALKVLRNRALQIDIYLLTYLLTCMTRCESSYLGAQGRKRATRNYKMRTLLWKCKIPLG